MSWIEEPFRRTRRPLKRDSSKIKSKEQRWAEISRIQSSSSIRMEEGEDDYYI